MEAKLWMESKKNRLKKLSPVFEDTESWDYCISDVDELPVN